MPALIDSGASSNFIAQEVVDHLQLKPLPLKVPTKIQSANGHLMDCVPMGVTLPLGFTEFPVVSSGGGLTHGNYFGTPIFAALRPLYLMEGRHPPHLQRYTVMGGAHGFRGFDDLRGPPRSFCGGYEITGGL